MKHALRLLPLFLLPLLGAPALAQPQAEDIRKLAEEALEAPGAVALSVAVARGDQMLFEEGLGIAELEHNVRANAETLFRIGSITKQVTAAAIVRQWEEGRIELDEDMRTYLPEYPEREHVVTVRHLLTHTSGIPSYTGLGERWSKTVPLELQHEELVALFSDLPFEFNPGARFNYNNSGYYLLGMILEKTTGQSYGEHLAGAFFRPLELTRTRIGSNTDLIANRAQGYQVVDGELKNDGLIGMSQPGAAGALLSTAGDLVRWQRGLVTGKVVDASSYEEMTTPFFLSSGRETNYGFGLIMEEFEGHRRVQHGGGINGFNSILAYYPEQELSVSVISNCEEYDASELERRLARMLLEMP